MTFVYYHKFHQHSKLPPSSGSDLLGAGVIDNSIDPPITIDVEIGGNVMTVSEFIVDDGITDMHGGGRKSTGLGSTKIIWTT